MCNNLSIFSFLCSVKNHFSVSCWMDHIPIHWFGFLKKKYSKKCICFLSSSIHYNFFQGAESPSTSKQQGDAQTRDSVHEQLPQCQQGQNIESGRGWEKMFFTPILTFSVHLPDIVYYLPSLTILILVET